MRETALIDGFEQLMRENRRVVFQIAFGVLGNTADAQDVTQDTFVRAYAKAATLRESGRFRAWVCTIARNLALNRVRGDLRARKREERAANENTAGVDVTVIAEERELTARVRREIDRLPEKQREAVMLCAVEGLPPVEVAAMLGISPGTVRSRLHVARKQLLRALAAVTVAGALILAAGLRIVDRPQATHSELTALTEWRSPTASLLEPPKISLEARHAPLLPPGGTHGS
jgi:RNA polymerase sigma-70 factor (ECF subfamily)